MSVSNMFDTSTTTDGPLNGVVVVDFTRMLSGPFCCMLLGELGATVIKVEHPKGGDDSRHAGPFYGANGHEKSAYFASINRGKLSIALDVKNSEDKAIFRQLLSKADVLVENFRPGTLDKWGLGWEDMHKAYPQLVYASVSGFGHSGPFSQRPAYDMVVQAMSGLMSLTGHPSSPPTRVGTSVGDIIPGIYTATAVCAALFHRQRTGQGLRIDVAMLDSLFSVLENAVARYSTTNQVPGPLGSRHPSLAPFQAYRSQDGHLVVAAANNKLFARLCDSIGAPELCTRKEFATNALRTHNVDSLQQALEAKLTTRTTHEWLEVFTENGIPCSPVANVADVIANPQIHSRSMLVRVPDAAAPGGELLVAGSPMKFNAWPQSTRRGKVPELDEHRDMILSRL